MCGNRVESVFHGLDDGRVGEAPNLDDDRGCLFSASVHEHVCDIGRGDSEFPVWRLHTVRCDVPVDRSDTCLCVRDVVAIGVGQLWPGCLDFGDSGTRHRHADEVSSVKAHDQFALSVSSKVGFARGDSIDCTVDRGEVARISQVSLDEDEGGPFTAGWEMR